MKLKTISRLVLRAPGAAWLFLFFSIFSTLVVISPAQAITGDYNKPVTGTLAASEWNNLVNDFVAKSGARLDGNFSINTATSSGYALDISGILRASHFSGSLSAADVSTGVFGQNTGGGNFNFLGNVGIGIGTASPAYTLDVAGIINANALYVNGAPYIGSQWISNGTSLYYNTGNVGIGISNPSAKFEVSGGNIFINDALITSATPKAAITKEYLDSALASTTTSIITQVATSSFWQGSLTGNVYNANTGNVGIGTTNPREKLEISGGNISIRNINPAGSIPSSTGFLKFYGDTTTTSFYSGIESYRGSYANILDLRFYTTYGVGATEKMRITPTGDVGIGVTSPGAKLDIATTPGSNVLRVAGSDPIYYMDLVPYVVGGGNYGYIFKPHGSSGSVNGLVIDTTGSVGIGTTNPTSKLYVIGNSTINQGITGTPAWNNYTLELRSNGADKVSLEFHRPGYSSSQIYSDDGSIAFGTQSGIEKMRITNTGNIGIGTTAPTYKLDVSGTGRFTQPVIVGTPTATNHAATKSYVDSTAGGGVGAGTSGQTLRHNGTSWVANSNLYNNGTNVGIGTTGPGAKLQVETNLDSLNYGLLLKNKIGTETGGNAVGLGFVLEASSGNQVKSGIVQERLASYGRGSMHFLVNNLADGSSASLADAKMTINSAGNVGIGTTAPTYKLDVSGTGRFTQPVVVGAPTDTNHAATKSYVDSAVVSGVTGGISGTTNYISKFTGANTIGNSQIFDNGTNVGIGTTTPGAKLDVNGLIKGTILASANIWSDASMGSLGGYNSMTFSSDSWPVGSKAFSFLTYPNSGSGVINEKIAIYNGDTGNIILNPKGGNVGIGTTNPGAPLEIKNNSTSGYVNSFKISALGAIAGHDFIMTNSYGRNLRIRQYNSKSTGPLSGSAFFQESGGSLLFVTNTANPIYFATNNRWATADMTIDSTGNVGIGTTAPAYKLDVSGTGRFTQPVIVGTPTVADHAATKSYVDSTAGGGVGAGTSGQTLRHNGTSWVANSNLYNNGTNVGIGTSNPLAKVQINNEGVFNTTTPGASAYYGLHFNGQTTADYATGITWNGGTSGTQAGIYVQGSGAYGTKMYFATTNSYATGAQNRMMINQNGFVGIGTIAPTYKLDVSGTGRFTQPVIVGAPTDTNHATTKSYVDSTIGGGSGSTVGYWTMNGTNISNSNTGNVGIGTTAPAYKLDVTGTGRFTQPVIVGAPTATNHATTKSYVDSAAGGGVGAGTTGQTLRHNGTSWVANSVLFNNGTNVGIGTSNPQQKLQVSGNAFITNKLVVGTESYVSYPFTEEPLINAYKNDVTLAVATGSLISMEANDQNTYLSFKTSPAYNAGLVFGNSVSLSIGKMIYDHVTNSLQITTNNSEQMRIDRFGNVGIGTTNPTQRLEVNGNAIIRSGSFSRIFMGGGGGDNFGIAFSSSYPNHGIFYQEGANDFIALSPNGGGTSTPVLMANQTGNVGIGTIAPTYTLDVSGTGRFIQPVIVGTPTVADHAATKSYVDSTIGGGSGSTVGYWTMNGTNISNSNTGNVGIGTTNPFLGQLHVNKLNAGGLGGDLWITNNAVNTIGNSSRISFSLDNSTDASSNAFIQAIVTNTSGFLTDLSFGTYGGGLIERMRITSSGNVGIGTSAPSSKLSVVATGASSTPLSLIQAFNNITYATGNGLGAARIELGHGMLHGYIEAGSYSEGDSSAGYLAFGNRQPTNNIVEVMRISPAGNVGIGTTAPTYKLDVSGTGRFTQPVIVGAPTDTNHAATKSYVDSTIGGGSGSTVGYWTMNGTNISNSNAGNVGIGTTDPGVYRLKVAGDVAITGTLQTQTGSDFAEEFRVTEDLEPGTVVVMAEEDYKSVKAADRAYDATVVGIVSDNPSIIAGKVDSDKKVVVAMMGVVSVKADVTNGRIRKGDLLTSSSVAGYAMKATKFIPGTIIGKALEDLNESGYLKVLVNLQ